MLCGVRVAIDPEVVVAESPVTGNTGDDGGVKFVELNMLKRLEPPQATLISRGEVRHCQRQKTHSHFCYRRICYCMLQRALVFIKKEG